MLSKEAAICSDLAEYIAALQYIDLPVDVVMTAKEAILDLLGCSIGGSQDPDLKMIEGVIVGSEKRGPATVLAHDYKASAINAAFVNASMGEVFMLNDGHNLAKTHTGVVVIPTALAIAEACGASGRDLITAVVAGYEVALRVCIGMGPTSHRLRGWRSATTGGPFGSAAAAGKVLKLDEAALASSLGLAGDQASGLYAWEEDGSRSFVFCTGRAAQSGIYAALLSQKGFKGPIHIFEAKDGGICNAMSDNYALSKITEGLGNEYLIKQRGVKMYPTCRSSHGAVDGIIALVKENGIPASDIEKIVIKTSHVVVVQNSNKKIRTMADAQMSLPYAVAVGAHDREIAIDHYYSRETFVNPEIMSLVDKVEMIVDPTIDKLYPAKRATEVEIVLKGGQTYRKYVPSARGYYDNPFSKEEMEEKFRQLAGRVLDRSKVKRILEIINGLEREENLNELSKHLSMP